MDASPVGALLQHWRRQRRMSQLVLSHEAGVTQRHVSFVESGRANPSREMVLTLARALDVPLRERNQMLLAAGYAPHYRETGLDAGSMAQVRAALDRMLAHHEPYPAVVMDRHWDVLEANRAAEAMFAFLLDEPAPEPPNVVRLMFTALRPYVANWDRTGEALVQRVHREAVGGIPDPRTTRLLD
jgi:transcriptional regulator with XRE-family HTH domain